ncbi:MAG: ABC transporter substrate-binding protein [Methanomicrobiales archaeon]|nr:ABC transporter substrate-binding protein [Methanomicrobiales archaeon]
MNFQSIAHVILILTIISCSGCLREESPPPESIPGPSIIEIEDIATSGSVFTINDASGREVEIPRNISHILCAGPACLRYLSYLQKPEYAVTNNPEERYVTKSAWIPYLVAYPEIKSLPSIQAPVYPAQILSLTPRPDLVVLMNTTGPYSADELSDMTGIPVLVLKEGNLVEHREDLDYSLRVMGLVTGSTDRALEVIRFFDKIVDNLHSRVSTIPEFQYKTAYIGGYTRDTPRGILSSSPDYYPFDLVKVRNSLEGDYTIPQNSDAVLLTPSRIKKLKPDSIFIDLTSLEKKKNAIQELEDYPEFSQTTAMKEGTVYGLYPTGIYGENHEIDLINAYCIGKVLYPDKFIDVDPKIMAEYILTYLYGRSIYEDINKDIGVFALNRIPVFT